jgi:hypothetical protein
MTPQLREREIDVEVPVGVMRSVTRFAATHAAPLSLFGAGMGWLLLGMSRDKRAQSAFGGDQSGADQAVRRLQARTDALGEQLSQSASRLGEQATVMGQRFAQDLGRAGERVVALSEKHPLATGLAVLAAGVAAAALLPPTRREDRWLGAPRDRLLQRARRSAEEMKDRMLEQADELRGLVAQFSQAAE